MHIVDNTQVLVRQAGMFKMLNLLINYSLALSSIHIQAIQQ